MHTWAASNCCYNIDRIDFAAVDRRHKDPSSPSKKKNWQVGAVGLVLVVCVAVKFSALLGL